MCHGLILENGKKCPKEITSGINAGDCKTGGRKCLEELTAEELEEIENLEPLNYYVPEGRTWEN